MERYRRMPLHLLVVLALLGWTGVQSASSSDCPDQYVYTQQPPQEIFACNPYTSGNLSMSCSVLGENIIDIQWWFAPGSVEENAIQLTESSNYTLVRRDFAQGLQIDLTINNLGSEDVGTYWCQASVEDIHGVQLLSTSESVKLEEKSYFDSQFINNACKFVLRNASPRCASILITPPTVTTTLPEPSISTVISSVLYPSPVTEPTNDKTASPQLPTTRPVYTTPSNPEISLQTSSIILYAVLGLVGFLAVICVLLIVVVVVLCRRKCASRDMKSCSEKDAGFDQFSNQSGYPPVFKHAESTRVIHAMNMHHRTMSGEYAEIGPALSVSQERGYSNVLHSSLPPIPTEMDPEQDQIPTPGYENPYDLLVFPQQIQTETDDVVVSSKLQERTEGADSQSLKSHEYHMLEQIAPVSLDSMIPVTSPQHTYHTLENTSTSLVPSGDNPDASSAYDDIIQREPCASQRLSFDSTCEPTRLPTIPENDLEDHRSTEYVNIIKPNHPSDAVSPDLSTRIDLKDCIGFSESSKDDGEYDRLIDPPHLYHILEHSPSLPGCPRIHNFDPTATYSHLETSPGHDVIGNTHLLPHVHFVSQQTDVTNASDTYSSESSLDATESNVFDDPRYLIGPPDCARVVQSACSMRDKLKELQRSQSYAQHGQPQALTHKDKTEAQSDSILMKKYSGDYERDPVYMQKLYNESGRNSSHSDTSTNVQQPLRVMDDSMWCDDSGFATYGSSRFSLQDRDKGSSLPNLAKHIYQPLETETLEPLQPYEKLKKSVKEIVI